MNFDIKIINVVLFYLKYKNAYKFFTTVFDILFNAYQ